MIGRAVLVGGPKPAEGERVWRAQMGRLSRLSLRDENVNVKQRESMIIKYYNACALNLQHDKMLLPDGNGDAVLSSWQDRTNSVP